MKKNTLTIKERRSLALMRAEIETLDKMKEERCISDEDYTIRVMEISKKVRTLEVKYGIL